MLQTLMERLAYTIVPGNPPAGFRHDEVYERAYQFWLSYQQSIRIEIGQPTERIDSDDFVRHSYVHVLLNEGTVVAMINTTLLNFDRRPAANHSYINTYFGPEFVARIRELGLHRMGTLENIVCDPQWRSGRIGISLAAVVMALALYKVIEVGCDGAFGAGRADAPTARIAYDLGGRGIIQGLHFHGKPTDLIAFPAAKICPHPSADVNQFATQLWARRFDTTLPDQPPSEPAKPKGST